jgi:soluble lytic murein transglycosylase
MIFIIMSNVKHDAVYHGASALPRTPVQNCDTGLKLMIDPKRMQNPCKGWMRLASRPSLLALLLASAAFLAPAMTVPTAMATDAPAMEELDQLESSPEELETGDEAAEAVIAPEAGSPAEDRQKELAAQFPDIDLDAYARALALYRGGNLSAGDAIRDQFDDPTARILLEWAGLRGGSVPDFERIATFMRENPDWPGRYLLRTRAEQALMNARPSDEMLLAFFASEKPRSTQGTVALAEALRREGAIDDAQALIRDIWRNTSLGDTSELRLMLTFPGTLTRNDHRIRMERRLFAQDWATARRAAALAGEDFVTLVEARQAVMRNPSGIAKALAAVPERLRNDSSYLFSRARHLRITEKYEEAAAIIAGAPRSLAVIADGDGWWTERRIVGRLMLERGKTQLAYDLVAGHAAQSPAEYIDAEFHAGWIALRFLEEPEKALEHFARAGARATTPISITRGAYWQARAHEALGNADTARQFYEEAARFPVSFYGQLAHQELGNNGLTLREIAADPDEQRKRRDATDTARAIKLLHAIGAEDLAATLLVDLGRTLEDAPLLQSFADLAEELGNHRGHLALSRTAVQRGLPMDLHAYPIRGIPDFPIIGPGVERALVYAIARQESAFDPNALSPAGARGLMQLMPGTARNTAERYGVKYEADRLLGDPVYSAKLGAAHLGELMDDWSGSYALAFAAYNAGPGHVRRWIQRFGDPRRADVDAIDWIEKIPFPETRNYVQRVMENLLVYRHRLGESRGLAIEADLRAGHLTR